jgi:hypothetical protein
LNEESTSSEALLAIRGLIDEIRLVPVDGALKIELFGELASLIALAAGDGGGIKHPRRDASGGLPTLVAGI